MHRIKYAHNHTVSQESRKYIVDGKNALRA
jgi:hypothetical protein